ncbi:unnamed protein product [Strongylus vulgaris]|uniref:VWFA domain-containing protein n=1 Tax=Strongylus vulgaris TaxID=40348 RepID=A0A3P7IWX4_STRVU|nr:unnamed protein product [Strongylus vulgaris]
MASRRRVLLVRNPWRPVQPDIGLDNIRCRRCDPITSKIAPVFDGITFAHGGGQHSRLSLVTYASKAETKFDLDYFTSAKEVMKEIRNVQAAEGTANLTVKADFDRTKTLAFKIRESGATIIVVAFGLERDPALMNELRKIASPGLLFSGATNDLTDKIQHALCSANCYCKSKWRQYEIQYGDTVEKYGECLRIGTTNDLAGKIRHALCSANCYCKSKWRQYEIQYGDIVEKYGECLRIGAYFWDQPKGKQPLLLKDGSFTNWKQGFPVPSEDDSCVVSAETGMWMTVS